MGIKSVLHAILFAFSVTSAQSVANDSRRSYPQLPYYGPNCWNFVLINKKAMPFYRMVGMHEFWLYVNSPYCRELSPQEKPLIGDIGSAISAEYGIIHSFLLISPTMVLSKASPYQDSQIEQQPLGELSNNQHEPLIYHRCDFSKMKLVDSSLHDLEDQIDKHLTAQLTLSGNQLNKMLNDLLGTREQLRNSPNAQNNKDYFLKTARLFKIDSLINQVFMLMSEKERTEFVSIETAQKLVEMSHDIQAKTEETKQLIKKRFK